LGLWESKIESVSPSQGLGLDFMFLVTSSAFKMGPLTKKALNSGLK